MKKEDNFDVYIKGRQIYDTEKSEIDLNTTGNYVQEGNIKYVYYHEYEEENPSQMHTAILKVEPKRVTITHEDSASRLILEKGKRHLCHYDTGYGTMTMGIFTTDIVMDFNDCGGKMTLNYTLDIDSNLSSTNEVSIEVKRRREEDNIF